MYIRKGKRGTMYFEYRVTRLSERKVLKEQWELTKCLIVWDYPNHYIMIVISFFRH